MDRVLGDLRRSCAQPERELERRMHFPVGWAPYVRDSMTWRDIYRYRAQHYGHRRRQLTLARARGS
jgi:hypothetical protein